MRHPASNILNVSISGLNEPLGVTDAHPIWSETRKNFVPAGQLQAGEFLRSETGIVSQITRITPHRGPPKFTYNLEVDGQHVYHVSAAGLLVHNDCFDFANDALASHPNAVRIRMDPNQHGIVGQLPGYPVAGQPSGIMYHHYFLLENGNLIDPAFPNGIGIDDWIAMLRNNNLDPLDEVGDFYRFTPDPYLLLTE